MKYDSKEIELSTINIIIACIVGASTFFGIGYTVGYNAMQSNYILIKDNYEDMKLDVKRKENKVEELYNENIVLKEQLSNKEEVNDSVIDPSILQSDLAVDLKHEFNLSTGRSYILEDYGLSISLILVEYDYDLERYRANFSVDVIGSISYEGYRTDGLVDVGHKLVLEEYQVMLHSTSYQSAQFMVIPNNEQCIRLFNRPL